jgi:hypothetical protein
VPGWLWINIPSRDGYLDGGRPDSIVAAGLNAATAGLGCLIMQAGDDPDARIDGAIGS